MTPPAEPVRVIYAKLTSTGDYDVVAKTSNIDLNAARSLAEKLLLGNVPHDARIDEELAYLRPSEGGHIFIRYTTYNWKDEHRGGAFMTDIVWMNDADFARARNNAFAVMPDSNAVYDVLTELDPVRVAERSAADDFDRLEEYGSSHGAGESGRAEIMMVAPAVMLGDAVLAIDRTDRRRRMELFTLLLPPRLRTTLTFQTRAFRVPAHPPRVTLSDELHANLQAGPWKHVVPNVSLDVPVGLAKTLVDAGSDTAILATAHELYERTGVSTEHFREECVRVVELIAFAEALAAKDMNRAFSLATVGRSAEVDAKLLEVFNRSSPDDIRAAVLASVESGGDAELLAQHLLSAVARSDANASIALAETAARRLVTLSRMPGHALASAIVATLTSAESADALVLFLGLDPRAAAAFSSISLPDTPAGEFVRVLADAARSKRDLAGARTMLTATARIAPRVTDAAAAAKLALLCREAMEASVDMAALEASDVAELGRLHDTIDVTLDAAPNLRNAVPQLFASSQLTRMSAAQAVDAGVARAERLHADAQAALAVALIARPSTDSPREISTAAARGLLTTLQPAMRSRVQRLLEKMGMGADALLDLKGGEELLPLLGRSTEQAASTRDLLQSVRDLADSDEPIARLAVAVLAARNAHMVLVRSHQAYAPLKAALSDTMTKRRSVGTHAGVLELTLDLLATITDADAFAELETAALANGGVTVRLRRLDRAVALCRAAEDEVAFEQLALAIESPDTQISDVSRQRLRDALGTGGLQRRLIQMITGVVERGAQ